MLPQGTAVSSNFNSVAESEVLPSDAALFSSLFLGGKGSPKNINRSTTFSSSCSWLQTCQSRRMSGLERAIDTSVTERTRILAGSGEPECQVMDLCLANRFVLKHISNFPRLL